jgi:glycosyltransferase involved in cell wall biosynthesis
LILGVTAAGSSLLVAILFLAAVRRSTWRSPPRPASSGPAVTISVIMPARNEEQDIGRAIESIRAQEDVELEMIVVNDHSTDQTGAIADAAALADGRIRVIHNPALPPGWLGKCNAMQQAAALATGEIFLFTDSDIM